jgi:hypothetical protein
MIYAGSTVYWRSEPALRGTVLEVSQWRTYVKVRIDAVPHGNWLWVGFTFWSELENWREQEPNA